MPLFIATADEVAERERARAWTTDTELLAMAVEGIHMQIAAWSKGYEPLRIPRPDREEGPEPEDVVTPQEFAALTGMGAGDG